jgi:hypothetical protein
MSGDDASPQYAGFSSTSRFQIVEPLLAFTQYRSPLQDPTNALSPATAGVETLPFPLSELSQMMLPSDSSRQCKPRAVGFESIVGQFET